MISFGNQNQFTSSFAPLGDLLKLLIFLSNLNDFNSSLSPLDQGFAKRKGSSKVWKEKDLKRLKVIQSLFLSPPLFLFMHYLCVLLSCFKSVQFYAILCLTCFYLFSVLLYFVFHKNKKNKKLKNQKNTKTVCVLCTLVLVYLGWPLKQNFLNFVSFVAQMSILMHN